MFRMTRSSAFRTKETVNRLHHSHSGHLRSMQMSATQLFAFVEGKQCDPYFFAGICSTTLDQRVSYKISMAREIPGNSGGKQALIAFFTFLRHRKSLVSTLGGQRTACVFFLDKDVDDLQHRKKRSLHAVYAEYYDVQNYVFQHGDVAKGTAAAASVDPRRLEGDLGDAPRWCKHVAMLWRDWLALCLRLLEDGIPCEANYRVLSRVQVRYCGPTNAQAHRALIRDLARRAGVPVAELTRRLSSTADKVERYFARGEHHRIFKGKWFAAILADDVDRIMAGNPYDGHGLAGRLPSAIAATLNFSEPWTEHFKQPLRNIAAML